MIAWRGQEGLGVTPSALRRQDKRACDSTRSIFPEVSRSTSHPISARRLSRRWPISVQDFPGVEGWKPDPLADAGPRERRPPRRVPRPRPPPRGSAARRAVTRAWSRASVAQPRSDGAGRGGPQGKQVDQPGGAYALTQWRSETLRLFIPHLCPVPGWAVRALPRSASVRGGCFGATSRWRDYIGHLEGRHHRKGSEEHHVVFSRCHVVISRMFRWCLGGVHE